MNKIILIIITLLFSFNAMAKVEIWNCTYKKVLEHNIDHSAIPTMRKIDTDIPAIYIKQQGKWKLIPTKNITYDLDDDSVVIIFYTEQRTYKHFFDLIKKEYYWYLDNKASIIQSCEVIE